MFRRKPSRMERPDNRPPEDGDMMELMISALAKNGKYISEIVEGPDGVGRVFFFRERPPLEAPEAEFIPDES